MKLCLNCGNGLIWNDEKFCDKCGNSKLKYNSIHCPKCHKTVFEYHEFCKNCGHSLKGKVIEEFHNNKRSFLHRLIDLFNRN